MYQQFKNYLKTTPLLPYLLAIIRFRNKILRMIGLSTLLNKRRKNITIGIINILSEKLVQQNVRLILVPSYNINQLGDVDKIKKITN